MNKIILDKGRVKQKLQTRSEILKAAQELMDQNAPFTLEDVAEKAKVSRATIYRYYSNISLLSTEAALDIHHKSSDEIAQEVEGMSLINRILHIQHHYNELAEKNELAFRRYISTVLQESVKSENKQLRGARRVEALKKSLAPFKEAMDRETFDNLIVLASVLMGIDALITCKDVCGLTGDEAGKTLKWGMEMILKGIAKEKV